MRFEPLVFMCLHSMFQDWSAEGYQLWMVNAKHRKTREDDPEFMPFPKENGGGEGDPVLENPLANKTLVLQFVKSPLAVNPGMVRKETNHLKKNPPFT
jgi:hypothetical protein